jgi:23S rRNA (adenine2503-C2)-methyltransferase
MVQSIAMNQIKELIAHLHSQGAGPRHVAHLLRLWVQALPQGPRRSQPEHFLPQRVRHGLPAWQAMLQGLATLQQRHPAEDGSERLLVKLADGKTVESVLLTPERIPGLCVSTQVGCAVGCGFCMTGQGGLLRQLGSAEIVAQVALARATFPERPVKKVVFMGMGEPAHNLEAVLEAIELLGTGGAIGHKNLVFSTVGDERVFQQLPQQRVKPALALSLHTSKAALRAQLLPRAPRFDPADLVDAGEAYARATGYPIQYQWTLIEGVNDGDDEVDGIVRLLHGKYALMNLIPYNTVDGMPWQRPSWERAAHMARTLHRRGILTKLRQSAGQDVDAGCGQLRARAADGSAAPVRRIAITAVAALQPSTATR